jgi:thimet oligopeptidase
MIGVRRIEATSRTGNAGHNTAAQVTGASPRRFRVSSYAPILDAVTLEAACRQMLADARAAFDRIIALPLDEVTAANVLDRWDAIAIALENIEGPIAILNNVHPDKSVRDAADAAVRSLSSFQVEIFQNEDLYRRVQAVRATAPAETQFRKDLVESFEDTGVTLPPDRRARAKAIADQLTALAQEFARNLRDNQTRMAFAPDEMLGLPEPYLSRQPRDAEGRYLLSFDYPDFNPFMANAESESARRRYYIGYLNRGTPRNLEILDEAVALRREIAALYDLPSFAHFVLRPAHGRHAGGRRAIPRDVNAACQQGEQRDLEELRALKAQRTGTPVHDVTVSRWDVPFLSERLREQRYNVDQESLRAYFPPTPTLAWLLDVSGALYGLKFEAASVPVWHEEVLYYDVHDAETNAFVGGIYFDLYPREGKFPHAAAWPVRGVSRKAGRTPISVLVTNFDRRGLTHDEVETLFHEFGHILHGVLSETTYSYHAGTSVQRDFVEAPVADLRGMDAPAREPRTPARGLSRLASDRCRAGGATRGGAQVRPGAVLRATVALRVVRYRPERPLAGTGSCASGNAWSQRRCSATCRTLRSRAPSAISSAGYAARVLRLHGAEVLALDMLSAFGGNVMDPVVGGRFRREILSRGGEEPANVIVERFLGRRSVPKLFFKEITGARP